MSAIEFVKECGIDVAKRTLNNAIGFGCVEIELFGGKYVFRTDDLKQIVDAWELVESYGGYGEVKWQTENKIMYINNQEHDLVKAINLVEQCQ